MPLNNLVQRFATKDPTLCAVCRRSATSGCGWAPRNAPMSKVIWLCDDPVCHHVAGDIYHMPQARLDVFEFEAARAGMNEHAGPYLDECGTTDLAALSEAQLDEFLQRFLRGFEDSMRRQILNHKAPF